jgi:hypothetical protein
LRCGFLKHSGGNYTIYQFREFLGQRTAATRTKKSHAQKNQYCKVTLEAAILGGVLRGGKVALQYYS